MKKLIPILAALQLLLMILGFCLLGGIFVSETQNLLGAVDQKASAVEGVHAYLESGNDYSDQGEAVLHEAGYGYSAGRYFFRILLRRFLPMGILLILAAPCIGWLQWHILRICNARLEKAEMEACQSRQKAAALEKELNDKLQEIGEYEENLYHQLKTGLTGIQLRAELLPPDSDLQIQLQKLSRLVTLFLRDRKLSSNMVKFHYYLEALDEILEGAAGQLQPYAAFSQVPLEIEIGDREYYLHCDANWLRETLVTLIENSIEHASPGTKVIVCLYQEQKNHVISIRSFGELLSAADQETLFTRFHSSKAGHFGIGLHMARTVVGQHHGRLAVYNHPDGDSVVIEVHLPRIDSPEIYT